jgi:hypothetical protein
MHRWNPRYMVKTEALPGASSQKAARHNVKGM